MTEVELERMLVSLIGDTSQYQRSMQEAVTATERASQQIQTSSNLIKGFSNEIQGFGNQALGVIGGLGISLSAIGSITQGIHLAADLEQTTIAFETMTGSASVADKTIKDIYAFAAHTPFQVPELLSAGKQLLAFGADAGQLVPTMRMLGDVSAGLNIPIGELTYLFGRMQQAGRVSSYELRLFSLRGIPIYQELQKQLHVTFNELQKMVEKGQIGFPQINKAFIDMTSAGGKFYNLTEKQSESLTGLFSTMKDNIGMALMELGKEVIEALDLKTVVKNVTWAAQQIEGWLKSLTPESKRLLGIGLMIAAGIMAVSAAFVLIGPVISMVMSLLSPVIAILGLIKAGFLLLLTPTGLVIAAVAAAAAAILYFSGAGGQAVSWFTQQWAKLKDYMQPAIDGIKDALAAGDIQLAFKILWVQIQLSFLEGTKGCQEIWTGFVWSFKKSWIEGSSGVQSVWQKAVMSMAAGFAWFGKLAGMYSQDQFDEMIKGMKQDLKQNLKDIDTSRDKNLKENEAQFDKDFDQIQKHLKDLNDERDKLVKEAHNKAKNAKSPELNIMPKMDPADFKPPPIKPLHVKVNLDWKGALIGSAEAAAEITEYMNNMRLNNPLTPSPIDQRMPMGRQPRGIPGAANVAPTVNGAGVEPDPSRDKMIALLGKAVEVLTEIAKKPGVTVKGAGIK